MLLVLLLDFIPLHDQIQKSIIPEVAKSRRGVRVAQVFTSLRYHVHCTVRLRKNVFITYIYEYKRKLLLLMRKMVL